MSFVTKYFFSFYTPRRHHCSLKYSPGLISGNIAVGIGFSVGAGRMVVATVVGRVVDSSVVGGLVVVVVVAG